MSFADEKPSVNDPPRCSIPIPPPSPAHDIGPPGGADGMAFYCAANVDFEHLTSSVFDSITARLAKDCRGISTYLISEFVYAMAIRGAIRRWGRLWIGRHRIRAKETEPSGLDDRDASHVAVWIIDLICSDIISFPS